jgi:hypothetical protein
MPPPYIFSEVTPMRIEREQSYMTSLALPYTTKGKLNALRFSRAQQAGGLPPSMKEIVIEAIEKLVAQELK